MAEGSTGMRVRPDENPRRFWVSSESDGEREYCVELNKWPLGLNKSGDMVFNGSCIATMDPNGMDEGHYGCKDFIYRCEPKLRRPDNMGRAFRCKHIIAVRDHLKDLSLDKIINVLIASDKNLDEEQMT
jgi:hypothetical protein